MSEFDSVVQADQIPRSLLRDLVALSSLPEFWVHRTPTEIADGLAGVLVSALYLDLASVALNIGPDNTAIEAVCTRSEKLSPQRAREVRRQLEVALQSEDAQDTPVALANPLGDGFLQAIKMPVGAADVQGQVIVAAREPGFAEESSRLLLRIAVNQAAVILRQKHIEEQLRCKQDELTDFLENASEGLHWVGADGTILWANQAELDMLGYGHEEYVGHKFHEFYADSILAEDIMQRLVDDQPVREYEVRLRSKDGSIRHVLINSTVYRENGKFIHTRCFTRDIIERKQMEQMLRRAYDDTELRVQFRTKELSAAIEALKEEIAIRQRAEAEVAELRGRLSESRESERLFIAQELHDGPIQDLFALYYRMTSLPGSGEHGGELESLQEGIMQVVGSLRRLCEDLRPSTLIAHGLEKAIHSHLEQFRQQHPSYTIETELMAGASPPERSSLALYRIYQQALANIVRHAQADRICIRFRVEENDAVLEVQDNGRGFTIPANWIEFARQGHFGLIGGFERAEAIGGQMTIESAPGQGTLIRARVPVDFQVK